MAIDGGTRPMRKAIHVGLSLGAAGVVAVLPALDAAVVLSGATAVALSVELMRRLSGPVREAFDRLFGPMLKDGEARGLTGATALSLGFTLTALLYPGGTALAGILFAGLGDPVASLVGRRFGRLRYPGGKSVAGSTAFAGVVFAVAVGLGVGPGAALATALILAAVEAFSSRYDDNLYLPVAGAAALVLGGMLTGM